MSMLVVQDVTNESAAAFTVNKNYKSQSSITPFKKVLKKEVQKKAVEATEPQKSKETSSVSGSSGTAAAGKTTLKNIFKRAAEKYDISYDFLTAVAKAESDFNTKCVSSAGAKGIMQLMPYECKEFGVTDPFNEEQNIMASAKLLKAHLKKFKGDYTLAAAAYNAGSGAVKKYGGVPPYKETQNYVKKIKKFMSEGVTVPDRKVSVKDTAKYTNSSSSTEDATKKTDTAQTPSAQVPVGFDTGRAATQDDLEKVVVSVGKGDSAVTMSYGAYLKYLELGTTGVG